MNIQPGIVLRSVPTTGDDYFNNALVFITAHHQNGAIGFVLNKKSGKFLNQLVAFKDSIAFPLYDGGPVDTEQLFFIHRRPDLITGGIAIADGMYYGGNFAEAVALLNNHSLTEKDVKIYIGYCGWDFNELEQEIAAGGWQIADAGTEIIF